MLYVRTKLVSLNLFYAKRVLAVLGASLSLCFICACFRFLVPSVFYSCSCCVSCCACLRFVKKIMWKIGVCKLWALEPRCVDVLVTLFGVGLFILNVKSSDLLDKCGVLKLNTSVRFIKNVCTELSLNVRKLLLNIWSLRTFKLNSVQTFLPLWLLYKFKALNFSQMLCNLGNWKLLSLRKTYFITFKRLANVLSCCSQIKAMILDKLGAWRVLIIRALNSFRVATPIITVKLVLEWCNLVLMCCWSALYCLTFYKILISNDRISFVSVLLNLLASLRERLLTAAFF
ncbi:MAG: hypothetical protein AAJB65_00085 [Candidatus Hodgkinia cicadicola]